MTPTKPKATLISKIDCARAIETFLAAGMVWSPDAPTDVAAITDAYYYALKDLTKDQLDKGIEKVITDTRNDARPWVPAANKLRWTIEEIERGTAGPVARPAKAVFIERAFATDPLGPLVRSYGEAEHLEYPEVGTMRCPVEGCVCDPEFVWIKAAAFGGMTDGWAARWVWGHVVLEQTLMRVKDGMPFERRT